MSLSVQDNYVNDGKITRICVINCDILVNVGKITLNYNINCDIFA